MVVFINTREISNEELFQLFSSLSKFSIFLILCDSNGNILNYSDNAPEFIVKNRNIFDVVDGLKEFIENIKYESSVSLDNFFSTKKSKELPIVEKLRLIPIIKKDNYLILGEVVTQKVLIDEYISERLNTLNMYLEFAPVFFVVLNKEGNIDYINSWALRKTGYNFEEIIGKNWFEIFIPEDIRNKVFDVFKLILDKKIELVQTYENEILTKDGKFITVLWENKLLVKNNEPFGTISVGVDVTDQKIKDFEDSILLELLSTFSESDYQKALGRISTVLSESCNFSFVKAEVITSEETHEFLMLDNTENNKYEQENLEGLKTYEKKSEDKTIRIYTKCEKLPKYATENCIKNVVNFLFSFADKFYYVQKLEEASFKDPLTGLYNRRYFMIMLKNEIRRAKRYGTNSSVMMIDLDGLKQINDTLGHDKGDLAIKTLAQAMISSTRVTDVCARFGGDEFAILLPQTPVDKAQVIVYRLKETLEKFNSESTEKFKIHFSAGITSIIKADDDEGINTLKRADELLYKAKSLGKNLIVIDNEYNE